MRTCKLTRTITEPEFDNGYWYATELRSFAIELGVPGHSSEPGALRQTRRARRARGIC